MTMISEDFFEEVSNSLLEFITAQELMAQKSEPEFLGLGCQLQVLYDETNAVTEEIRNSAGMIGRSDSGDGALSQLGSSVRDSLAKLAQSQEAVQTSLQHVDILEKRLTEFYRAAPILAKIAQYLRVVGINVCIESSQSREATRLFMINAQEIKDFAENVIEITNNICEDTQKARQILTVAQKKIAAGFNEMQEVAVSASLMVQEAFNGIEELMQIAIDVTSQADDRAKVISQQVGEVVMGIQFHDNMRQRIEHINTALHEVISLCADEEISSKEKNIEQAAIAHAIIQVQAGQVEEIIAGIDEVYQQNSEAFIEIYQEVEKLIVTLMNLVSEGSDEVASGQAGTAVQLAESPGDSFALLQEALLNLQEIMDKGSVQVSQIRQAGEEASETTAHLGDHINRMRAISHEIHLKSLNGLIKACHLGDKGKTIAVLAEEIKVLSLQSNSFVGSVDGIYQDIVDCINGLHSQSGWESSTQLSSDSLKDDSVKVIQVHGQFSHDSQAALRRARELASQIKEASGGLDFLHDLAEGVRGNAKLLDAILECLSPWQGQVDKETLLKSIGSMERYTMEKERTVHQNLLAGDDDPLELFSDDPPVDLLVQSESEDDLGDNVDLF